jgi:hypothetical protein
MTDAKQWDEFQATLADKVAIDFVGVQPHAAVTARELREQSEPSYQIKTQHVSTNLDIRVDGDKATPTSYAHVMSERPHHRASQRIRKETSGDH